MQQNESVLSQRIECGAGSVAVLLASYNGEKYIAEQLDSLFSLQAVDIFRGVLFTEKGGELSYENHLLF